LSGYIDLQMWHVSLFVVAALAAGQAGRAPGRCVGDDDSIVRLECALEGDPDDVGIRTSLGNAYFGAGRWLEALAQYEHALRIEPDDESVRLRIAAVFLEASLAEEADETLTAVSAMFPDSNLPEYNQFYFRLAELYAERGRLGDARRVMETAASYEGPVDPAVVYKRLGDFQSDLIEPDAAREAYARALELDPENLPARTALAGLDLAEGRLEEALDGYRRLLRYDRAAADAYQGMAEAHFAAGRFAEAVTEAEQAVELAPGLAGPHYVLGRALLMTDREAEGRRELAEYTRIQQLVLAADHQARELHAYQSDALVRFYRGRTDDAIAVLRAGIARYPDAADLYLSLGLVLSQSDRHAEAVETYSTLVERVPGAANRVAPHLERERRLAAPRQ
jgi:tetratricopeptide (TPR) repeat protein